MGLRINKRIKICKGLYLNVGKKGISTSAKIGNMTFNSKGTVSASIPGTGISYRANLKSSNKKNIQNTVPEVRYDKNRYVYFFLTLFFGYLGAHKFYMGEFKRGVLYALTFGLFAFGWARDLITATKFIIKR